MPLVYPGFQDCYSFCHVRVGKFKGKVTVMVTEHSENPGTSITNAIENVAARAWEEYLKDDYPGLKPNEVRWIEHYQANSVSAEQWLEVKFEGSKKKPFENPGWSLLENDAVTKGDWEYR